MASFSALSAAYNSSSYLPLLCTISNCSLPLATSSFHSLLFSFLICRFHSAADPACPSSSSSSPYLPNNTSHSSFQPTPPVSRFSIYYVIKKTCSLTAPLSCGLVMRLVFPRGLVIRLTDVGALLIRWVWGSLRLALTLYIYMYRRECKYTTMYIVIRN